jgi:hypothetical protein
MNDNSFPGEIRGVGVSRKKMRGEGDRICGNEDLEKVLVTCYNVFHEFVSNNFLGRALLELL